jgi:two-component system sensor histidine kinase PhoQ
VQQLVKPLSLQTRLLIMATVVLTVFLGLTGLVLDRAFRSSSESAQQGRMEGQLYGLLGATELDQQSQLVMATGLADARFSRPGSGLIAQVVDGHGRLTWQSASALGLTVPVPEVLGVDVTDFQRVVVGNQHWFRYSYGIAWIDDQDQEHRYSYTVLESPLIFNQQVAGFRRALVIWLAAAALLLLVVQALVLRWSLTPLRRIEEEVHEVEKGDRQQLTEDVPRELKGLSASLNLLLANERRHLQRYRNSLSDLAHSMKTPLAVLRGIAESEKITDENRQLIENEVGQMDSIVEYQLQKAATAGRVSLTEGVAILPVLNRLLDSLRKVYRDKNISYAVDVDEGAIFMGEEGDLMEAVGNVLDNASKWCQSTVSINVARIRSNTGAHDRHSFIIEDDGKGIAEVQAEHLLQRGARGDTQIPGHGIGLAVVGEIVSAYGGRLKITRSHLGGAKVELEI